MAKIGLNIKMKGNIKLAIEIANLVMLVQFIPKKTMKDVEKQLAKMTSIINEGIVSDAIENKVFTKTEYNKKYKDKYIEKGIDVFPSMVGFIMAGSPVFVTRNKKLIKNDAEIFKRFGIEVIGQDKFVENQIKMQEEANKTPSYVG